MTNNKTYKNLIIYYLLTVGFTWLILIPAVMQSLGRQTYNVSNDSFIMAATFMPSIIALLFTYAKYGKKQMVNLIIRTVQYRLPVKTYLYIFFLMPCTLLIAYFFTKLLAGSQLNSVLLPTLEGQPWLIFPIFLYMLALQGPLGEELGWRGFVLDRLLKLKKPLTASIILGLCWTLWHLPLFFINGSIQFQIAANGLLVALIGYLLYTVMLTVLMTVLYLETNGSIFAALLFHTVANLSHGLITIIASPTGGMLILLVMFCITVLVVKLFYNILSPDKY